MVLITFIALLIGASFQVSAQTYSLDTNFGEVELAEGFSPDPQAVSLYAGGTIDLSESTEFTCQGFISESPDYRISYSVGDEGYILSAFVESEIDTVLLISAPNGEWFCNDDFSEEYGQMPGIEFTSPVDGVYDIWVGVYNLEDEYPAAELLITERGISVASGPGEPGTSSGTDTSSRPQNTGSGTAFVISNLGHLITNYHVIDGCESITFQLPGQLAIEASVISSNLNSDLALLKTNLSIVPADFRSQNRLRLGDEIVVYGFPLRSELSSQGNITTGVVSALTGMGDDLTQFQISAQIQPGNSGGPVFDRYGQIVGVVVSMANEEYFSRQSGNSPQDINFAITANITESFLDINNINYTQTNNSVELSIADIADKAQSITGTLLCFR